MKHWHYLSYVVRHKWFVFCECCRLGVPFLGLIHDWSKFLPSEWFPYVESFYGKRRHPDEFDYAWLLHQKRNPHHWQYWILIQDEDENKVLPMPDKYRREMFADWIGAGRAITGSRNNVIGWYQKNHQKMQLHQDTRTWIESALKDFEK